ncbi:MAG: exodeoxyribonuclease V subunit gamma [Clostridiales bacterium]|nr:exodeoxyribonuclease V subunit gamma [Clostridiales bacterium]
MSQIEILSGRAGAGKTRKVLRRVKEHMDRGEPVFLLVPEQSTFEAERALAELAGGLVGAEVYGFGRLCERILQAAGNVTPTLSRQGRVMVMRRVIGQNERKLTLFARAAKTPGFAERMDELACTLKKSNITPEALAAAVEKLEPQSQLAMKLSDIGLLYAASEAFLAPRYLTEDDGPTAVLSLLPTSFLAGAYVYVDGIDNPSHQMFSLLAAIVRCAARVTFTLRLDEENAPLFAPDQRIFERLRVLAAEQAIPLSHTPLTESEPHPTPALAHLERYLFAGSGPAFAGEARAVTQTAASTPYEEVEFLAEQILSLARKGTRYRDMAVIAGDVEAYAPLIARAFALRGIPLFYDAKRPILGHAAAELLLAGVAAVAQGYRAEDILRVLKSGYSGCAREDIEVFENYILRYGVTGGEMKRPFAFGEVPEIAQAVRARIMAPLTALHEGLRHPTVAAKAEAVYDFLVQLKLAEQLQEQARALLAAGEKSAAQVSAQVWNAIVTLLSQLHTIMGEERISMRDFSAVLAEGVRGYDAGLLPGTADQVLLGDVRRTRVGKLDTLFVVGCREGALPRAFSDDALLNDRELNRMEESGLTVWDGSQLLAQSDRLALYTALCKAQRRLFFSYAFASGGETLAPSPLLGRVRGLLPNAIHQTALGGDESWPACQRTAFHALALAVEKQRRGEGESPLLPALLDYFSGTEYEPRAQRILNGEALRLSPPPFDRETVDAMYGGLEKASASRLERFAKCPFAHFAQYGLGAKERPEAEEKPADEGSFLHDALDAFIRQAALDGKDLLTLSDEEAEAMLREIAENLHRAHKGGLLLRDDSLREALFLRMEALTQSVFSLLCHLRAGRFVPLATELRFGYAEGLPPVVLTLADGRRLALQGKIDRVDTAQSEGERLVRVVDYKRSEHTLKAPELADGTALQLPLYLEAATRGEERAAGMYYMSLTPDFPDDLTSDGRTAPQAEETQGEGALPTRLLVGMTDSSPETIAASDSGFADKSTVIGQLARNKNGKLKASDALATQQELQKVRRIAKQVAARLAEDILRGEAAVSPMKGGCKHCAYGSLCRFDSRLPDCRERKKADVKWKTLLAREEVSLHD